MSAAAQVQAVTFGLGDEVFALSVTMVREILDYTPAFRVPHGPDWMLGLTDVRGQGVPMVDLRTRLGLARAEPTLATRVLIVDVPLADRQVALGLVVDRVLAVATFSADRIEAAPDIGLRWRSDYIQGVVRDAGAFVVLVDIARIFAADVAALGVAA
ncbi:chemotaxis protein CheW [Sphingomonas sp. CROZ-RG-20F-R02-07]|uniref:chemotaxis protein CheW n=1 Tax=Sphingomonas sp. CROZ-RG-20F-R02-07 TaxID=2914832 RepID=UPI001F5929CA|nr:chemotaxis protein CheW [Sphingomonas sp. CROZ-RG-20F-R02-07]